MTPKDKVRQQTDAMLIAVTADIIATSTDIKPLKCLLFGALLRMFDPYNAEEGMVIGDIRQPPTRRVLPPFHPPKSIRRVATTPDESVTS